MSDSAPSYLESNKPEAERCVEMAAAAWKAGDLAKAQRMLQKSLKLYPTVQAQRLIESLAADVERTQAREQARQENARQAAHEQAQQRQREFQQQQQQQPRQQAYQRPAAAAAAAAASTPSKSASAAASSPATPGANYTVEQSESARVIISKRKNYYEIFSVSRTATESEIKSSYRKLALRFHPDKNKAPEAEEAFKVVNAAFQCLSDADKRAHYDAYGVEEPNGGGGGRQQQYRQQYQREEDFSPEDIFNAFFNGGMGVGGGGARRTYTYRRQAAPRHAQHDPNDGSPAAIFSQFAHFLPLLLLLLFGLLSAPGGDEQVFSLDKSGAFPVARMSAHARVPYFVSNQFAYRYQRDRRAMEQVEAQVEAQAFKLAEEQCNKQKRALADEERRVKKEFRGKNLAARLQALQDRHLDACERLSAFKANLHGAKAG